MSGSYHQVARLGDIDTGHDDCPPTDIITASPNVYANDIRVAREGDSLREHGCPAHPEHPRKILKGTSRCYANNIPIARHTDPVDCGGNLDERSPNVSAKDP